MRSYYSARAQRRSFFFANEITIKQGLEVMRPAAPASPTGRSNLLRAASAKAHSHQFKTLRKFVRGGRGIFFVDVKMPPMADLYNSRNC